MLVRSRARVYVRRLLPTIVVVLVVALRARVVVLKDLKFSFQLSKLANYVLKRVEGLRARLKAEVVVKALS